MSNYFAGELLPFKLYFIVPFKTRIDIISNLKIFFTSMYTIISTPEALRCSIIIFSCVVSHYRDTQI